MSEGGINAPDNDTPINVLFSQFPKLDHETIRVCILYFDYDSIHIKYIFIMVRKYIIKIVKQMKMKHL